jgi:hypothetical protein
MPKFDCTVRRMQVWNIDGVEAENAEEAKNKADRIAATEEDYPDDDYAYETTAREVRE